MRWFITYGDDKFRAAKDKIIEEAISTGQFDNFLAYGKENLSSELLSSNLIKIPRGGGLWSWKPDVIWSTMQQAKEGDIIVYCDSGCTVQKSKEWARYWKLLETHDIIAQRILKRTDKWTRKEIIDHFSEIEYRWTSCYQYQATVVILCNNEFTRKFISEWRSLILTYPKFLMDVTIEERPYQHKSLIENRHDQAIYSALIYNYLNEKAIKNKVHTQWEHIEDLDIFSKQAIRATRLRLGEEESTKKKLQRICKRFIKDFILCPFVYSPLQWFHSRGKCGITNI